MSLITSEEITADNGKKLQQVIDAIPQIISQLENPEYDEIFGYRINTSDKEGVQENVRNEILYKYLKASEHDVDKTIERLVKSLNWRNEFRPLSAAYEEKFDAELETLGVISVFPESKDRDNLSIVTWNIYANIKSPKKLFEQFGDKEEDKNVSEAKGTKPKTAKLPGSPFLRWRIGLMERSLSSADFTSKNNNKIAQIHDYNNVSMFRIDPGMKQATKEIISIFGDHYPELLSVKFFINVPTLMSWMFAAVRALGVVSAETAKKFQVLNSGDVSEWFPKQKLPKKYGGAETDGKETSLESTQASVDFKPPAYGQVILQKGAKEIPTATKAVEEPKQAETSPQHEPVVPEVAEVSEKAQ